MRKTSRRGKRSRGEVVFQIEEARQLRLVDDRRAQHGLRPVPRDVGIAREEPFLRCIVQHHVFSGACDVMDDRGGQRAARIGGNRLQHDFLPTHRALGLDEKLALFFEKQEAPLRARVFENQFHQLAQ
jgi:hypothetical protein